MRRLLLVAALAALPAAAIDVASFGAKVELKSAAIVGNRFEGGAPRIVNQSKGDVQVLANVRQ
jgi:hypothetical protein